jgi:hypothetical protein
MSRRDSVNNHTHARPVFSCATLCTRT